MRCKCSCPRRCYDMRDWCRSCRLEWEAEQERQYELRRLSDAWDADAAAQPATAEEWQAFWDESAPPIEAIVA